MSHENMDSLVFRVTTEAELPDCETPTTPALRFIALETSHVRSSVPRKRSPHGAVMVAP